MHIRNVRRTTNAVESERFSGALRFASRCSSFCLFLERKMMYRRMSKVQAVPSFCFFRKKDDVSTVKSSIGSGREQVRSTRCLSLDSMPDAKRPASSEGRGGDSSAEEENLKLNGKDTPNDSASNEEHTDPVECQSV